MSTNHKLDGLSTSSVEVDGFELSGFATGPERNLLSALLFDGIQAYFSYCLNESQVMKDKYIEAYRWVQSDDSEYVFSYINVCEALGIDPQNLRLGLLNFVHSNRSLKELNSEDNSNSTGTSAVGTTYRKARRQST